MGRSGLAAVALFTGVTPQLSTAVLSLAKAFHRVGVGVLAIRQRAVPSRVVVEGQLGADGDVADGEESKVVELVIAVVSGGNCNDLTAGVAAVVDEAGG